MTWVFSHRDGHMDSLPPYLPYPSVEQEMAAERSHGNAVAATGNPSPSRTTTRCFAPSRPRRLRAGRRRPPRGFMSRALVRSKHESNALDVNRFPVVPMNEEVQLLLIARREHHNRPSRARHVLCTLPHELTNTRGHSSDEDTGRDLEQPTRQIATKPGRAGRENDDDHRQSSLPYAVPPDTTRCDPSHR